MHELTRLVATGSPADVGTAHGAGFSAEIREYVSDRVELSAYGTELRREAIINIAHNMLDAHAAYDPDLYAEMLSMAQAAGITPEEAVIVGGYTDFIDTVRSVAGGSQFEDTCTAVITPNAQSDGAGFLAQTWDMHSSATPHVFILDVATNDDPRALVFTTHGTLGQIGMNDEGIAIGIANLTVTDGGHGVTWPFVVRKALKQRSFTDALECITTAPLAGAHNFLLLDAHGSGVSIEATPTAKHVQSLDSHPLVHTNHCIGAETAAVEADRPEALVRSSTDRIVHATELLNNTPHTVEKLKDLLRDERSICRFPDPTFGYESAGAAIMRPGTGDFWACWGIPSQNEFEHYQLPQGL